MNNIRVKNKITGNQITGSIVQIIPAYKYLYSINNALYLQRVIRYYTDIYPDWLLKNMVYVLLDNPEKACTPEDTERTIEEEKNSPYVNNLTHDNLKTYNVLAFPEDDLEIID